MAFPDVQKTLVGAMSDLGLTCTRLPVDLAERLPVIQFKRIGGGGTDNRYHDRARVDVVVCAATEDECVEISETIRDRLTLEPVAFDGVVLDGADTETAPIRLEYPDPEAMTQYRATYRISTRRQ